MGCKAVVESERVEEVKTERMIRLSIIVPFYGVEKYIEECIRSLYAQDIPQEEYEVICVDDCSPDGSRAIVERLQKEYSTLRLICHERNKKLGGARNTGLKVAEGQYIWFVDSDDYVSPNVLQTLLKTAENSNLDILQFDYTKGERECQIFDPRKEICSGETYLFDNKSQRWYDKLSGAWLQIFKREFLVHQKLEFTEEAMYEDTDYLIRAFIEASKVQHVSMFVYNYRVNELSVTESPMTPIKLAWRVNLFARCGDLVELTTKANASLLISQMISNSLSNIRNYLKCFTFNEKIVYVRNLSDHVRFCRSYVNWRTWLAIRYGITLFI